MTQLGRWLARALVVLSVFVALCAAWLVFASYMNKGRCVVLPNGYMIGHVSVFKFKRDFHVDMYLRDPSGKIVVRTDGGINFERVPIDPNMVRMLYAGGAMEMSGVKMMPLIWEGHPISGEKRKWNEPDPDYPDSTSIIATDFWTVFLRLERSRDFERVGCGTPWFDWGDE